MNETSIFDFAASTSLLESNPHSGEHGLAHNLDDHHLTNNYMYNPTIMEVGYTLGGTQEGCEVTGNVKGQASLTSYALPPSSFTDQTLEAAWPLPLSLVPVAPEALALVNALLVQVEAHEAPLRKRKRGARNRTALTAALGTVLGGLLRCWADATPRLAAQKASQGAFTGSGIAYRHFAAIMQALTARGFVGTAPGIRYTVDVFGAQVWQGRVTRFWPTTKLLILAEHHRLYANLVKGAFNRQVSITPPVVGASVIVRTFGAQDRRQVAKKSDLPFDRADPRFCGLFAEVEAHNAFAASVAVEGCLPPRWFRIFTEDQRLHGRWYAAGRETYQTMSEEKRVAEIRIAGEPVVEVDVCASHLSILHGLHGLSLPAGDLYDVAPGVPRHIAKAWLTLTLGRGRAKPSWGRKSTDEQRSYDAGSILDAMASAYPFLHDLRAIVPVDLGRTHGGQRGLVSHYLMGVEAQALTGATARLRDLGHLALPMHDGLVVPVTAEAVAMRCLTDAFYGIAGVRPKIDVSQ